MKTTTFLALACTAAAANPQSYGYPTPVRRDAETITSVAAQVSDAITQLATTIGAFNEDGAQVVSDAAIVVAAVKDGIVAIASSGASPDDAGGLGAVAEGLETATMSLTASIEAKEAAIEASDDCEDVRVSIQGVADAFQSWIDAFVTKLGGDSQEAAAQFNSGIEDALQSGIQCPSTGSNATTTATTTVPYPTGSGSNSTTILPTGGATTTMPSSPIATAGAAGNGAGAMGLVAGLAAALLV
ncbi:hydrophobic surface binding protein A-domain-containing protein [Xylaria arbuscula]|nr:hydrophobic surface binding protein A-domain-containing protein [Xylaria arbuscula]